MTQNTGQTRQFTMHVRSTWVYPAGWALQPLGSGQQAAGGEAGGLPALCARLQRLQPISARSPPPVWQPLTSASSQGDHAGDPRVDWRVDQYLLEKNKQTALRVVCSSGC